MKTIEEIYNAHIEKEPNPSHKILTKEYSIETEEHIKWRIVKESIQSVMDIPKEKRQEVLDHLKKGNSIGKTAEYFGFSSTSVGNLLYYNIESIPILRSKSL